MPFLDIIGHQAQLEFLRKSLEGNRLHHAYLFLGPDGVGKRTVALCLAAAVHCARGGGDSCGCCESCLCVRDGNHPDVHVVGPGTGKREITIQQVRELQRRLAFRPFSGRKKVAIIDPAHALNYHAQNSLLRTLEDPPGDSLLILIANSVGNLLPTVVSRCLRLSFAFLPEKEVAIFLLGQGEMVPERARLLAALSKGSLGEALMYEASGFLEQRKRWIEEFTSLSRGNPPGVIEMAGRLAGDREESLRFLEWLGGWYRDVFLVHITGSTEQLTNVDMVDKIRETAGLVGAGHVLSVLRQLGRLVGQLNRNYNRRLVLENFLLKIVSPG